MYELRVEPTRLRPVNSDQKRHRLLLPSRLDRICPAGKNTKDQLESPLLDRWWTTYPTAGEAAVGVATSLI